MYIRTLSGPSRIENSFYPSGLYLCVLSLSSCDDLVNMSFLYNSINLNRSVASKSPSNRIKPSPCVNGSFLYGCMNGHIKKKNICLSHYIFIILRATSLNATKYTLSPCESTHLRTVWIIIESCNWTSLLFTFHHFQSRIYLTSSNPIASDRVNKVTWPWLWCINVQCFIFRTISLSNRNQ